MQKDIGNITKEKDTLRKKQKEMLEKTHKNQNEKCFYQTQDG